MTGEADFRKHAGDADLHLRIWNTIQSKRQRDVLRHAQVGQDVKSLEHEPHVLPSQHRQRIVVERGKIGAVQTDAARVGTIQTRDEVEQRGLADARLAHHGDVLALAYIEADVAQDGLVAWSSERLRQAA